MSNQTNKTNKSTQASQRQQKPKAPVADAVDVAEATTNEKRTFIPKDVDPNQIVTVRNGFQGPLTYISKKTGEKFKWETFGAEQDMELSELKNARNSNKKFFINNWFMFDEQWVPEYLGLTQYYKYALKIEDFDSLFTKSAAEVEAAVSKLSDGQKKSVAYRARQLIAAREIDSNRVIETLEKCLGVDLVDRL